MYQLNQTQLQALLDLLEHRQTEQAEQFLIAHLQLDPTAAKNLVRILYESSDALQAFKANPQILSGEMPNIKNESNSFEFNFSSSTVKMTNQDGKTIEINDQHPDWQEIKKQFQIDLTQPDALSKFAENFMQGQTQNTSSQAKSSSYDSTSPTHALVQTSGVEDLSHQNKSSSMLLLIGFLVLIGIAAFYYFKT